MDPQKLDEFLRFAAKHVTVVHVDVCGMGFGLAELLERAGWVVVREHRAPLVP